MAREGKRIELKPVEDPTVLQTPVFRLESDGTGHREKPMRLDVDSGSSEVSQRLDLPSREDSESRTHQPDIDDLIGSDSTDPDIFEKGWGKESTEHKPIPWGWFALIGLMLAGAIIWSLAQVSDADSQAIKAREQTATVLKQDAEEEQEAAQVVERIQACIRQFFQAGTVGEMLPLIRQPDRVQPLMEDYYSITPIMPKKTLGTLRFEPLTIEGRASFWLTTVELEDHERKNLIVETRKSGEPRIDWETFVCHQPMDWDRFARERPENESFDFRVYVALDHFYSHEFADSSKWVSFRLTTPGGEESIFGYANFNKSVAGEILELLNRNQGRPCSLVLRLTVPQGLKSRNGVVIEKLVSPRWIHVDPPDSGS